MELDYILVGQGLAGSLMAKTLLAAGQRIRLWDGAHRGSSSMVAAGLINPITGRRFALSWRFEACYAQAKACYQALEAEYGQVFWQDRQVAMLSPDIAGLNNWQSRTGLPEYQAYTERVQPQYAKLQAVFPHSLGAAEFGGAARLKLPLLLETLRGDFLRQNILCPESFDYQQLVLKEQGLRYGDYEAKGIIFCEGHAWAKNPYFQDIQALQVAKGEVLLLRLPDFPCPEVLAKQGLFFAHWQDDLYWVGSFYDWTYAQEGPTPQGRERLLAQVEEVYQGAYTVEAHWAAVRPTVKDRRPLLGSHPRFPQLMVFNGLGTKGSLLAPSCALWLRDYILAGKPLEPEVDLRRYWPGA